jgi:hypothetical protein
MRDRAAMAARSVAAPFSFMHRTIRLRPGRLAEGIERIFCDGELLGDIAYAAPIAALQEQQHQAR